MSRDAEPQPTDEPNRTSAETPVHSLPGDYHQSLADVSIDNLDQETPDEVVAFRLGRAVWRLLTIILPRAVSNHSYYQTEAGSLRILLDAALGRLALPSAALSIQTELSSQFDDWDAWLGSETRCEELECFFRELEFMELLYGGEELITNRIDGLYLSPNEDFRREVEQLMQSILSTDILHRCYALGRMTEEGIQPEYPPALTIHFRDDPNRRRRSIDPSNSSSELARPRPVPQWIIESMPILPGELDPGSNWPGLLANRLRELRLTVPNDLLFRIADSERESVTAQDDTSHENGLLSVEDGPAVNHAEPIAPPCRDSYEVRQAARRRVRLHCFSELVTLIENGLTSLPSNANTDVQNPPYSTETSSQISTLEVDEPESTDCEQQERNWCHDHEPDEESRYRHPVHGELTMRQMQLALDLSKNTIRTQARSGRIWVMKLGRSRYRIWMQSREAAEHANRRLAAESGS